MCTAEYEEKKRVKVKESEDSKRRKQMQFVYSTKAHTLGCTGSTDEWSGVNHGRFSCGG